MSSAADLAEVLKKYAALRTSWDARNIAVCGQLLQDLKLLIINLTLMPTEGKGVEQKELMVVREILEIGAQYSVEVKDVPAFERYMAYLKTYYMDYSKDMPESAKMYELIGLNLLRLLAQNRLVEFHTELELLPASALLQNPYIAKSVKLEQFIMEGSYNKVIEIKDSVPAESYRVFMEILLDTIRNEIASCMEKAYDDISIPDCAKMLNLDPTNLEEYIKSRGWKAANGRIRFESAEESEKKSDDDLVPTKELAQMVLSYAKEMEKIV